jgi:hypothetical protein
MIVVDFIWGQNGRSLFDPYSLQHLVWFFALTVALAAIGAKRAWIWGACLAVVWEVFEWWIVTACPSFPFAGPEMLLNKVIGDTLSDAAGFLLAAWAVKAIRSREKCQVFKRFQ